MTFPDFPDLTTYLGPTRFPRTVDGGATWQPAQVIFDPGGPNNQTLGNQIAVLPDGTLVNVFTWIIHDELHVGVQRSADKGRTWSQPLLVDRMRSLTTIDPRDGALVRDGNLLLDVAVDPRAGSDDVYLVWQDARFTGGRRNQVAFSRSSDGGRTWSRPARVSQNLGTQAFTPSVAVDADGNVGVTYYDFSFDTVTSAVLATDHWFTRSRNRGRTWSQRERVTGSSFDTRMAPNAGGYFVGDYVGLAASGERFTPLFPVTLDDANPTDTLATTVHRPFDASPSSQALLEPGEVGQPGVPGRLPAGAVRTPLRRPTGGADLEVADGETRTQRTWDRARPWHSPAAPLTAWHRTKRGEPRPLRPGQSRRRHSRRRVRAASSSGTPGAADHRGQRLSRQRDGLRAAGAHAPQRAGCQRPG